MLILCQEVLLAVTNTNEGYNFVDESNPPTNLTEYVEQLFPLIESVITQAIVQQYSDDPSLPDVLSQAIAILGECKSPGTAATMAIILTTDQRSLYVRRTHLWRRLETTHIRYSLAVSG